MKYIVRIVHLPSAVQSSCLSVWNAFMQTGSLRLHRKYSVMSFLFSWRGSLSEARPSLIYCRFHSDTYAHIISLSHFETHSLWHILISFSISLALALALLDCDVSSSFGLPAVLAHLEVRHAVGGDRSDRTHACWDRSTRAVSHETVPQALKITLKSRSKAERTESRRAVAI